MIHSAPTLNSIAAKATPDIQPAILITQKEIVCSTVLQKLRRCRALKICQIFKYSRKTF